MNKDFVAKIYPDKVVCVDILGLTELTLDKEYDVIDSKSGYRNNFYLVVNDYGKASWLFDYRFKEIK